MANRFLDTNYYKSPFVRGLKGSLKSLYSFIICDCDGAGIWHLDLQAASLYIGFEISLQEFENHFINTGKAIPIGQNRYFFPDFIEHQYPKGLQSNNPAQKNFISTLKKFNLIDDNLIIKKGAKEGLQSPIGNGNGIGNGEGNGNWNTRPSKNEMSLELDETKGGAVIELFSISKKYNLTENELAGLWEVFKKQNFDGVKYYGSKNDVYSHFINWSKNQNIENGSKKNFGNSSTGGTKLGTSDARVDAASKF